MSKLLKLRGFVSVNEAQDYLSKAIGENVSLAEIYQLVLNRDLVISARFDAHEPALLGKYIPFTPEQHSEWLKKVRFLKSGIGLMLITFTTMNTKSNTMRSNRL